MKPKFFTFLMLVSSIPAFAEFRAAAVKVDITPDSPQWLLGYGPRKSTGVNDRIYHRVLAMSDGQTQFYLVSSDLCLFSPELYDQTAAELERQLGISRKQFWWTVTHTHSAPEVGPPGVYKVLLKGRSDHEWDRDYTAQMQASLVRAVREAQSKLEPARIAMGAGTSMANINRRAKDVDGTVRLGLNPEGPVDRQIGLMRLERTDGSPIALVANYAMHGTVMSGENKLISGDGPGIASAYVEEKLGAPVLYVNGAAGNAAPIYSVYPTPKAGHLSEFRVLLGEKILEANAKLPRAGSPKTFRVDEITVETPLKAGLEWPPELGRYAREQGGSGVVLRLPVRFLRIDKIAIWSAPVELFSEIAMEVRQHSPFEQTFYFGYANGWFGYLPTAAAMDEGGYEPTTSPFTKSAAGEVTQQVEGLLRRDFGVK